MRKFVQEKFQVNEPYNANDDGGFWTDDKSARTKKGNPGREGRPGGDPLSRYTDLTANFNSLPPGMDIEDQGIADHRKFNSSIAGNYAEGHNAGDVTQDCTEKSIKSGYDRKVCCPTDDMYTREHNDAFYDDPEVDGKHGFIERNNYLDRL